VAGGNAELERLLPLQALLPSADFLAAPQRGFVEVTAKELGAKQTGFLKMCR
jgi:hypothetical protein